MKTVVLGFDALDPRLCRRWMDAGELPNLAALAAEGGFAPLATTTPCQSPVAWRSFATGCNPGKHGVFDFLTRVPGTYLPSLAFTGRRERPLLREEWQRWGAALALGGMVGAIGGLAARHQPLTRRGLLGLGLGGLVALGAKRGTDRILPHSVTEPVNLAEGTPFWATLSDAGQRSTVLWIPAEFPARTYANARVVSGLGIPDVRGTNGTFSLYATSLDHDRRTVLGGDLTALRLRDGRAEVTVCGPPDPLSPTRAPLRLPLELERQGDHLGLRIDGHVLSLVAGEWSPWLRLHFRSGPLVEVAGTGRFLLRSLGEQVELYLSPLNFDLAELPTTVRITAPAAYAGELADRHGFFKTLGWPTDTWALTEERISDHEYLDDFTATFAKQRAVALAEMERDDWECFVAVFLPTDHIQHTFWRFLDEGHARHEADAEPRLRDAVLDAYRAADAHVGEVRKRLAADTVLFVVSDHGFHPWRTAVNLNTWLVEQGLMRLKPGAAQQDMNLFDLSEGSGLFFDHVDWFNTKAYSLGLGNLYLNLAGREPQGIVKAGGEAEALLGVISERLLALHDPAGDAVVRSVYLGKDIYHGPCIDRAADLLVGFHPGYRVSWQTCLGGAPPGIFAVNDRKWSGDHCSLDPAITPGVVFCNRPLPAEGLSLLDLAPTILARHGLKPQAEIDGSAWPLPR